MLVPGESARVNLLQTLSWAAQWLFEMLGVQLARPLSHLCSKVDRVVILRANQTNMASGREEGLRFGEVPPVHQTALAAANLAIGIHCSFSSR